MIRVVVALLALLALAAGFSWLADNPGSIRIDFKDYLIETSVFRAVVVGALLAAVGAFLWSLGRQILTSPAALGRYFNRRRQERGLDALTSGMIAIGAGDRMSATRHAVQARRALPNEPLTHLLRAQAAQLAGDRSTSRRIFEAMLSSPDTEQLGLRGLFLEARHENEAEAARQFAERALRLNPGLGWAIDALLEMQCRDADWAHALDTVAAGRRSGHFDKASADRRRAVLLTAQAQALEETNGPKAQQVALEAHGLAPDLIPAATIAARQLASRGSTPKAAKVVERTWKVEPHPDLALVYAFARPGDSPRDRLDRIKRLSRLAPQSNEGPIALATAAIDAREWDEARQALAPLVAGDGDGRLTQRVCTLMARIEGGEHNDAGRVREWLGRAVNAPRDPAWTADGAVAERWAPVSPVTGQLDAFHWRVPPEPTGESDAGRALRHIEELVLLGSEPEARARAGNAQTRSGGEATRDADEAPGLEPAGRATPLRPRQPPDADRPITVEVRPVAPAADAGKAEVARREPAKADPAVGGGVSSSGVPLHPQRRDAEEAEVRAPKPAPEKSRSA
jgi:HemY protein